VRGLESTVLGGSAFGSVHSAFHSTAFRIVWNSVFLLAIVFWLGLAFWVFRDARRRIDDPWLVATATLLGLVVPYLGPIIYLLFRPPETLADVR
jgi:4-amino-4-deoxy-L-arabinose transferase-like glycosyltransferase